MDNDENEKLFEALSTPGKEKVPIDAINDFTRARLGGQRIRYHEDPFMRRIIPPIEIKNDELDRSVSTDIPVDVHDVMTKEEHDAAWKLRLACLDTHPSRAPHNYYAPALVEGSKAYAAYQPLKHEPSIPKVVDNER